MKYDIGLLRDDPPENFRSYQWAGRGRWTHSTFPEDVRHEIAVFLATPGITINWFYTNLPVGREYVRRMKDELPGYDDLKKDVAENWVSATREDCVRLCRRRPGGSGHIPVLSQLQMLRDFKNMTHAAIIRDYGVSKHVVDVLSRTRVPRVREPLPSGFELLWLTS